MSGVVTPQLTTRDLYGLLDTSIRFQEDLATDSVAITAGTCRRSAEIVAQSLLGPWGVDHLIGGLASEARDWAMSMATVAPMAAERAAENLVRPPRESLSEFNVPISGTAPVARGRVYDIDGKPLLMPARIADASEAWAMWFVPVAAAQARLGKRGEHLRVVDLGGGRTSLTLFAVEHRHSDLGSYLEMSLGLCVVPRNDVSAVPGVTSITVAVNAEFTRRATRIVWGIDKLMAPHMAATFAEEAVTFRLNTQRPSGLSATFPRLRMSRSTTISIPLYTVKEDSEGMPKPLQATILRRGDGEGTQISGNVGVTLGERDGGCCLGPDVTGPDCLCRTMRELGVAGRLPAANGWTDHMSGSFSAPHRPPFNHSEIHA